MTQDNRAHRQVNVVHFKVRYKSTTVDEFSERHRLEVSPRGIFVQTAKPLALGAMVKFDVQLASKQTVIKGAGCVVWIRDLAHSSRTRPPGMGVQFIEVDGPSKALIDQLVRGREDAGLAYEEPLEDATIVEPARSPARQGASTLAGPGASVRRPTLMGIGVSPTSMFPEIDARAEVPSQSEPTVIEEMSELLDTELSEEETLTETLSPQFFSRPVVAGAVAGAPDLRPPPVVGTPERSRGRKLRGMRAWVAVTLLTAVVLVPARHMHKVFRGETVTTPVATVRAADSETTPAAAAFTSSAAPAAASPAPTSTRAPRPAAKGAAPLHATPKRRWRPASTGADDNPY